MRKNALPFLLAAGIAAAAFTTSTQAFAYGAGDFFTRVGVAKVEPKSDNGDLDLSSLGLNVQDVEVDDDSAFAFTLGYRFTDKLGVELLAAEPFDHDFQVGDVTGGSVDHLPPTLTVQYYPLGGTDARVQPYAGIGVNHTLFSDEELDADLPVEFDDSWGAAGQVGVDLLIGDNWALNAAAWYLDIDTDVTVNDIDADEVEIDPVVVMAGVSYRF
ncbi:MAG: OmpW family outer membrane protein [Halomonas sp.]|nr:OmpW family outer membrane protein [Halomonas sp.]